MQKEYTWGGTMEGEDCVSRGSKVCIVDAPAELYSVKPEDRVSVLVHRIVLLTSKKASACHGREESW